MKKVLLLTLAIMICASMAFAQAGGIGLYVDAGTYVACDYTDTGNALVPVYVVHKLCPGATASQWMLVAGVGFNCTYTGEIIALPTSIGSTQSGISIAYGGCLGATNLLLATVNYFCMGISPTCASLEIVADPAAPTGLIEVIDCAFVKHQGVGSMLFINNDGSCGRPCGLPTNETSWGQIKSMYND